MKYIVVETEDGGKFPFIFPENIVHADMLLYAMACLTEAKIHLTKCASAGFVDFGSEHPGGVACHGSSESLKGLKPAVGDAARIVLGANVTYMSDQVCQTLFEMMPDS